MHVGIVHRFTFLEADSATAVLEYAELSEKRPLEHAMSDDPDNWLRRGDLVNDASERSEVPVRIQCGHCGRTTTPYREHWPKRDIVFGNVADRILEHAPLTDEARLGHLFHCTQATSSFQNKMDACIGWRCRTLGRIYDNNNLSPMTLIFVLLTADVWTRLVGFERFDDAEDIVRYFGNMTLSQYACSLRIDVSSWKTVIDELNIGGETLNTIAEKTAKEPLDELLLSWLPDKIARPEYWTDPELFESTCQQGRNAETCQNDAQSASSPTNLVEEEISKVSDLNPNGSSQTSPDGSCRTRSQWPRLSSYFLPRTSSQIGPATPRSPQISPPAVLYRGQSEPNGAYLGRQAHRYLQSKPFLRVSKSFQITTSPPPDGIDSRNDASHFSTSAVAGGIPAISTKPAGQDGEVSGFGDPAHELSEGAGSEGRLSSDRDKPMLPAIVVTDGTIAEKPSVRHSPWLSRDGSGKRSSERSLGSPHSSSETEKTSQSSGEQFSLKKSWEKARRRKRNQKEATMARDHRALKRIGGEEVDSDTIPMLASMDYLSGLEHSL